MSFALLRQNDARCHKFRERRFLFTVDRVQKLKVATQSSTEENAAIVAMKNMLFGCLDWLVGWKKTEKEKQICHKLGINNSLCGIRMWLTVFRSTRAPPPKKRESTLSVPKTRQTKKE